MQRILLIQLRQLGDILLTTPAIRAVREFYPDAELHFLAHKMGNLILKDNPHIDRLITYTEKDSVFAQLKLMKELRQNRYDLVIDFMYNPRSAIFALSTGCKTRVAFPSRRNFAFTKIVPKPPSDYIVREKFHILQALDIPASNENLVLPWREKDLGPYGDFLAKHQLDKTRPRMVLSATHRREVRQWPRERYASLADELVRKYKAVVIWAWGPGEKDFVEEARSLCKEETLMAPDTSFSELAAFFANCDLFIGNSNGPSHVAVSSRIPSLQLHGPTIAKAWCPNNTIHHSVQEAEMADISLEQISLKVTEMMPIIEKNLSLRLANGDRISWDQPKELTL